MTNDQEMDRQMADAERIRRAIREIAQRPKNVTLEEIQWVVNQLRAFETVAEPRKAKHGWLFRVGDASPFLVNSHNPGSKQVKEYSVKDFLSVMIEIGWYEE